MTGQLVYSRIQPDVPLKETKLVFELSNGSYLNYNDQRLFGRLTLFRRLEDVKHFAILGPEPFDTTFNPQFIKDSLKRRNMAIKTVLMDHTFVAGIGNIYASEILFRSGISPKRSARRLKIDEIERMHKMTLQVLEEAITHRGSSMRNYRDGYGEKGTFNKLIKVYAREGESCERCKGPILKIVQGGRSTFYCKNCQH
jgi:formamidopyrimidine-DNA glycosylase